MSTTQRRPRPSSLKRRRALEGVAYAAPTAALIGVFFLIPLGLSVWMSFNDWPLVGKSTFNGGANYSLVTDEQVLSAAGFTLLYTAITTVLLVVLALGLALIVQQKRAGVGLFRTVYFMPAAVGLATASLIFAAMFSPQIGDLNAITRAVGLGDIDWLGTPEMALLSTVILILWRYAGFYMLILLTGLQGIPAEVYEAARVDGATAWQTFIRITIPLLRASLLLVLILCVTGSLLAFEQFYVLTGGGPDNATVTLVMVLYRQAFVFFDLGGAAALSIVLLLALLIINGIQLLVLRKKD